MLPKDPAILLSYVNTRLRDRYPSLDELCDDLEVDGAEVEESLARIGYRYDREQNRFR
ncbi:MAG: DUF4250 domain-containing protein [Clostridia bacterium]|nr:DUF4250 domain-containing protein [Clostridia bacterium]